MLVETPKWTFSSQKPLSQWYGHVVLLPDDVLGQWFCLARESGELKWQHNIFRANRFCGVDCGIIVADEMRSDGPWTSSFGCYGISLEDGQMLWKSHGTGLRGWLGHLLDYVPGLTNEIRDSPHHVKDGQVFCYSGRVLDIHTGKTLKKISPDAVQLFQQPKSLAKQLYQTSGIYSLLEEPLQKEVSIGKGISLYHPEYERGQPRKDWAIIAKNDNGQELWRCTTKQLYEWYIGGNFYSYRLAVPYIYLIVSEEPATKPDPKNEKYHVPNPTIWHLITLDVWSGDIVQEISLGSEMLTECRIEDLDDDHVLIGNSNQELFMYERIHETVSASI